MDGAGGPPAQPPSFIITPLLISLAGILATTLSIVTYHLVMVKYCLRRERRDNDHNNPPRPSANDDTPYTGVEEKVLNTIPILCYSSSSAPEENDDYNDDEDNHKNKLYCVDESECVICLGQLEDGEMVRLLPNCKHMFHVQCIDEWFIAHASCPFCRAPIVASIKETEISIPIEDQNLPNGGGGDSDGVDRASASDHVTSQVQSNVSFLRHSVSLVLPMERKPECLVTGLRRSLSLDRSSYVLIDIQGESDQGYSSSSSSYSTDALMKDYKSTSSMGMRRLEPLSSRLLMSLSQLRMGRNSSTDI